MYSVRVVPESFTKGLLIPILKKPNIDPSVTKHYRLVTMSVILSKILEYLIFEECASHKFSDSQYGFVAGRGCSMATALAHDVSVYANASGSTVFYCSLNTKDAFDCLPLPIILSKTIGAVPDKYWRILYTWYSRMCVFIKLKDKLGKKIEVNRGTRQ